MNTIYQYIQPMICCKLRSLATSGRIGFLILATCKLISCSLERSPVIMDNMGSGALGVGCKSSLHILDMLMEHLLSPSCSRIEHILISHPSLNFGLTAGGGLIRSLILSIIILFLYITFILLVALNFLRVYFIY